VTVALLLDTSILSAHIKRPASTFTRFITHGGQLCTSQVVIGELYAWAFLAKTGKKHETRMQSIKELRLAVEVPPFDGNCAKEFGEIKIKAGTMAGAVDLMIAATAIVHNAVIVSHDVHFLRLQEIMRELHAVDWPELWS
jgi:predicted nucleic acid-binding protein